MVSCARAGEKPNIVTVAWTGTICSDPVMVSISVRPERYSYDIIRETGEFVINLTTKELTEATDWCGVKSGRDVDKFKEMNLTPVAADVVGCPMIGEAPVNLECKVKEIHKYPSHHMFVAEIVAVHVDETLFDENGRIQMEEAGLLAYVHGEYRGIKKHGIGRFGFSVMKPKTRKRISRDQHRARVEKNRARRQAQTDKKKPKR
jgi:flavin reductase (DIM6/NTAB) family NADH-FMN oxidoreductase RutF